MDLAANLRLNAWRRPNHMALVASDGRWSYAQLCADAHRVANALAAGSPAVAPGDRVAVVMGNSGAHVLVLYALANLGAVAVPLGPGLAPGILADTLHDAGCVRGFWEGTRDGLPPEALAVLPAGAWICTHAGEPGGLDDLLRGGSPRAPDATVSEADDLVILYSSGTTGRPKGITLTHRCRVFYVMGFGIEFRVTGEDVFMVATPLYHNGAQMWLHSMLYMGGTVVLLGSWQPEIVPSTMAKVGVTSTFMVPTQVADLVEVMVGRQWAGGPVTVVTGAAPVPFRLKERFLHELRWPLYEAYGLTETGVLTVLRPHEQLERPGSVGRSFLDCQLELVSPATATPARDTGELAASSACMMRCYHGRSAETAKAFMGPLFLTGDIARRDADGYFYIIDRKKDLIITGGVNVYSRDVEEVLLQHPGVREAAVIGLPDPRWGEAVTAMVVPVEGWSGDEAEILSFCRQHLSPSQVPKCVILQDALPRNSMGKVLRRELRDRVLARNQR